MEWPIVMQVVLLLRLSPLLPLSLSNYLYGLTSVDFVPYVLGSWLGQLPGTFAYVSAGKCQLPPIRPCCLRTIAVTRRFSCGNHTWLFHFGKLVCGH